MKANKLIVAVTGILAVALGFVVKGKTTTDFQNRLSQVINVDTAVYLADGHTIGQTPSRDKSVG